MHIVRLFLTYALLSASSVGAETLHVAVASNFSPILKTIAQRFEARSGHHVRISSGSTGKHYAQIKNGAPFDVFLAADALRPQRLEAAGQTHGRFTYALGRLVLWSAQNDYVDAQGQVLEHGHFQRLALANPKLAPYGQAAYQVLSAKNLWQKYRQRLVLGENVAQAFGFVHSKNAQLGFVAYAQIKRIGEQGSFWLVPAHLHDPIEQQAVLLSTKQAAYAFFEYLRTPEIQDMIQRAGYDIPPTL